MGQGLCPPKLDARFEMRLDVYLNACCLVRRRSEAKRACDNGIVTVEGQKAKPSRVLHVGQRVCIAFSDHLLEFEVIAMPRGNVSRKQAPNFYRIVRDEARAPEFF